MSSTPPELIDVHLHVGKLYVDEGAITPEGAIAYLDAAGIGRAAVLPIESPEEAHCYVTTEQVLDICAQYPDRFIPFCNVDPRIGTGDNSRHIALRLQYAAARGCKGLGEAMSGLYIDAPGLQYTYAACGELGLPIIFHIDGYRNIDEKGFPRLERMLRQFPQTIFVGHGQHFWAEISGDVTPAQFNIYPPGPIAPGGAILRLLADYPNLYADLSAGSCYNALTRDPDPTFGMRFLQQYHEKLFFGTDLCRQDQLDSVPPIVRYLRAALESGSLTPEAYRALACDNAVRVFGFTG